MDLNKPEKINEKALSQMNKRLESIEPKLIKYVTDWVTKFRTSNGNIVRDKANKARLGAFKRSMKRFLRDAGYYIMVDSFLQNFDLISDSDIEVHKELNGLDLAKSFLNPFKNSAIQAVLDGMTRGGLNINLLEPLRKELFTAVYQGSSLTDVLTSISGQLATTEQRQGIVKRLSVQVSRDALLQYDGVVNEAVRKTYKMDGIRYIGSLVKDSRLQCERWVSFGTLAFADLEEEISWAEDNGTGMIPNTTPENFCQNRGGYNCRHQCYPVRLPKPKP